MSHFGPVRPWPHGYYTRTFRSASPRPADHGARDARSTARGSGRVVQLAAQAVRPPASRQRLLRRSTDRRWRRTATSSRSRSTSASTSPLPTAPPFTPLHPAGIVWEPERPETIAIRDQRRPRFFAYWHIVPAVRNGQYAIALAQTLLGHIAKGWGHVHFWPSCVGRPLRESAAAAARSTPYVDRTRPTIHTFSFERERQRACGRPSWPGAIDLVVETCDETPVTVPGKWAHRPVMPAVVRWRVLGRSNLATPWRTAIDFSGTIPATNRVRRRSMRSGLGRTTPGGPADTES